MLVTKGVCVSGDKFCSSAARAIRYQSADFGFSVSLLHLLLYGKFQNGTQRIRFMYHVWSKWEAAILWLPFGRKIKRNCVNLLTAQQPQNSPVRLSTYHALELPHTGPTTDHACTNTNIQSQMYETINLLYLSVYITNYEINKMPTRIWIHNDLYTSTKFFNR